jgi:hypothetical protein
MKRITKSIFLFILMVHWCSAKSASIFEPDLRNWVSAVTILHMPLQFMKLGQCCYNFAIFSMQAFLDQTGPFLKDKDKSVLGRREGQNYPKYLHSGILQRIVKLQWH